MIRVLAKQRKIKFSVLLKYILAVRLFGSLLLNSNLRKFREIHEIINAIDESGFSELPIIAQHAALVCGLEPIHKDPFDRLLIATAIYEPLTFLTADATLKQYSELVEVVSI